MLARLRDAFAHRSNRFFFVALLLTVLYYCFQRSRNVFKSSMTPFLNRPNRFSSIEETDPKRIAHYYRHATTARNSSYPYISGDTFRAMADFVFDETKRDDLKKVQYGDIVFVKADMFFAFFPSAFDSIRNPFVLVTHNSDFAAPAQYQSYLSNKKILHWFASNPSVRNVQKLSPIPIGLANTRWHHGDLQRLTNASQHLRKPWSSRTMLLYVNFDIGTNRAERQKARDQAGKFAQDHVLIIQKRIPQETYLEQIGNAKFVLSPPGNGLDCHRTWEAMLMGAVPIMLSSGLDPLFSETRSVILDNWSKLTEDFLSQLKLSPDDGRLSDVLTARYWRQRLVHFRENRTKSLS